MENGLKKPKDFTALVVTRRSFTQPSPPLYCSATVECIAGRLEDPDADILYVKVNPSWKDLKRTLSFSDKCLWQDCIWRIQNKAYTMSGEPAIYVYRFELRYLYDADEGKLLEQLGVEDA